MSNKLGVVKFSQNQPIPWRIIDAGLCLEGRCLANKGSCPAYEQMVIGNKRLGQFTISRMTNFPCPLCGTIVRAEKFGLNRCKWRITNTQKWSIVGDMYETYNLSGFPIHIEINQVGKDDESIDDCSICLVPMDKKSSCSILPCKHIFHMGCIQEWIDADEETSLQCPICRQEIFN